MIHTNLLMVLLSEVGVFLRYTLVNCWIFSVLQHLVTLAPKVYSRLLPPFISFSLPCFLFNMFRLVIDYFI